MGAAELERELRAILPHWLDDDYLHRSALWDSSLLAVASRDRAPAVLREVVGGALARLQLPTDAEDHLAYRAVQLAYLTRRVSNEAAAERLAVSRATFYRLLKRGVRGLAVALSTA